MTDPVRPTDEELTQRIRRSMDHYRLDRPAPVVAGHRGGRPWQIGRLVAAAAGGAAVAIVLLSLLRGFPSTPIGTEPPSASPSPSLPASAGPTPAPPSDEEASAGCLALGEDDVLEEWLEPGESAASVADRIRALPVVLRDSEPTGSVFVFADDRFVVTCDWSATTGAPEGIARGVREHPGDPPVMLLFAFSEVDTEPPAPDFDADQIAVGTARDDVADVTVVLESGTLVRATIRDGLWLARWQEAAEADTLRASDASGSLIDEVPAVPASLSPTPGS